MQQLDTQNASYVVSFTFVGSPHSVKCVEVLDHGPDWMRVIVRDDEPPWFVNLRNVTHVLVHLV